MTAKHLTPIHPGEILEQEFMRPLELSANSLARALDVPVTRISEIVRGRRGVTADTALRFARVFGTSAELWLGLQAEYDLRVAREEFGPSIERRVLPLKTVGRRRSNTVQKAAEASEVRESAASYGVGRPAATRDRRRVRASSPSGRSK
jgi:addiction module HigA family antidote